MLPLVFFFNQKNKAFWTGIGQLTIAIAGLLPLLAFLAIPKVEQDLVHKEDKQEKEVELCLQEENSGQSSEGTSSELPDWMDNDRDLLGLICIPIVIMNLTEELSVRTEI